MLTGESPDGARGICAFQYWFEREVCAMADCKELCINNLCILRMIFF